MDFKIVNYFLCEVNFDGAQAFEYIYNNITCK